MDYDRWDALLHHVFKATQGDAWFRPQEQHVSSGVVVRINDTPEFRVFPYENIALEPFETAVAALNPAVAVKVRSAAVHAALADVSDDDKSIHVDANTRIQILETMLLLPSAEKEQCAAFIRDERVLVVWSDSLDTITSICQDFEDRLIKLLWRSRPPATPTATATASVNGSRVASVRRMSLATTLGGSSSLGLKVGGTGNAGDDKMNPSNNNTSPNSVTPSYSRTPSRSSRGDKEKEEGEDGGGARPTVKVKRNWFGKKIGVVVTPVDGSVDGVGDEENQSPEPRPASLFAPVYNGVAAGLACVFIGNGVKTLLQEWSLDGSFIRFALCATLPALYCVSLFFALQIVQNVTMAIGPIAHYHTNSKYYSAVKPRSNKVVDNDLPHITIQMPVFKESLETVLAPSIYSLKKAMQTYARQGGTSTIFINDDGLRTLPAGDRDERISFYAHHNIGWVARPKHDPSPNGYKRAGRFKKASNMNYGLALSLKVEKHLEKLIAAAAVAGDRDRSNVDQSGGGNDGGKGEAMRNGESTTPGSRCQSRLGLYGMRYRNRNEDDDEDDDDVGVRRGEMRGARFAVGSESGNGGDEDLEERALEMGIEEMWEESGRRFRPWAANGRATRLGEIVLLVDADTIVPEDCLRDAAREMRECPTVAIIQHESDVMQIAHHYFENGIAYFTRRINRCISMACANGEVAPFMGHNSFLRWKAIQDAAFIDPADGQEKIWSESNVSEDFDMALRLLLKGYIIRWATYSKGGFKEGVSLSVDDELNRWQKYAYGCSELLFNPLIQWWRKGPIARQIHRFMWSRAPMHYKISILAYMFSYYGIAASVTIATINYVLLGFQFPVDGFYMHSFEIWLATTVVFFGSGNVGYTLLEYRLGHKKLLDAALENLMWIPFFFFFFGGLSIPLTQAILAHLFSYNISWSATVKEVRRSNFFKEIPKIAKRFWFPLIVAFILIVGVVVCSSSLVPLAWRVDGTDWAIIFPIAVVTGCHILFPIVLNPWLMVFSY